MEKKQNPFKNAYWRYQVINAGTKKKPILNIHEVWINRKQGKYLHILRELKILMNGITWMI